MGCRYVNFMPDGDEAAPAEAYGRNYRRLTEIEAEWDSDNLFRVNFNLQAGE